MVVCCIRCFKKIETLPKIIERIGKAINGRAYVFDSIDRMVNCRIELKNTNFLRRIAIDVLPLKYFLHYPIILCLILRVLDPESPSSDLKPWLYQLQFRWYPKMNITFWKETFDKTQTIAHKVSAFTNPSKKDLWKNYSNYSTFTKICIAVTRLEVNDYFIFLTFI